MSNPFTSSPGGTPPPVITPPTPTAPPVGAPPSVGAPAPVAAPIAGAFDPSGVSDVLAAQKPELTGQQFQEQDQGPLAGLGKALFGQDNGSLLGGTFLGEAGRKAGQNVGEAFKATFGLEIAPIQVAATVLSHIPLGWATGSDAAFEQVGQQLLASGKEDAYAAWLAVQAAGEADKLNGGNLKADYLNELGQAQADEMRDDPRNAGAILMTAGNQYQGSFGGIVANSLQTQLGVQSAYVQRGIAGSSVGSFADNPLAQLTDMVTLGTSVITGMTAEQKNDLIAKLEADGVGQNRVQTLAKQYADDPESLGPVEQFVAKNIADGVWSDEHGLDYLTSHNEAYSDNFLIQMYGQILTDPLTYETIGAGAIAKSAGTVGARAIFRIEEAARLSGDADAIARAAQLTKAVGKAAKAAQKVQVADAAEKASLAQRAADANTVYQRAAAVSQRIRLDPVWGSAAKVARGLIDPFSLIPHNSSMNGILQLNADNSAAAFDSTYHAGTAQTFDRFAIEDGTTAALDRAKAGYVADQARVMMAEDARAVEMKTSFGEELSKVTPAETADLMQKAASKDLLVRLGDHMFKNSKWIFTAADEVQLATRAAITFGRDTRVWAARIAKMSTQEKSALHALSFKAQEYELAVAMAKVDRAAYLGDAPLERLVLHNENNLSDVSREAILGDLKAAKPLGPKAQADVWNRAAGQYALVAELGHATGGEAEMQLLAAELRKLPVDRIMTPLELGHPSLASLKELSGRSGGAWEFAFRPSEVDAWGLRRNPTTGMLQISHSPMIAHVVDAAPAAAPFSRTTHNFLGQIIGLKAAGKLNRPVESIEAFVKSARTQFSGQRLVLDMQKRFEASMSLELGLPKQDIADLWRGARDTANLQSTTIKGLQPKDLEKTLEAIVPEKLKTVVTSRVVLDHLLKAADGDIRVVGLGTKWAQKIRTGLVRSGADASNDVGHMTVTQYNNLRYRMNPVFRIQRVTDGPYFSLMAGVQPVGRTLHDPSKVALGRLMDNIGRTSLGRDFAMDQFEYAIHSNFAENLHTAITAKVGGVARFEGLRNIIDSTVRANEINLIHADLGTAVRGALDEIRDTVIPAIAKEDPAKGAAMLAQLDGSFTRSFEAMAEHYSGLAERTLTDNEVGMAYINQMFDSSTRRTLNPVTGKIDLTDLIGEKAYMGTHDIGEVRVIDQPSVARAMGYVDDGQGLGVTKMAEDFQTEGAKVWREKLRTLGADKDYINRFVHVQQFNWQTTMTAVRHEFNLTGPQIRELQDTLGSLAQVRGVTPAEYVSQIMSTNVTATSMKTGLGRLAAAMQAAKTAKDPMTEFSRIFAQHLDPSSQSALALHFQSELPFHIAEAEAAGDVSKVRILKQTQETLRQGTSNISETMLDPLHPEVYSALHPQGELGLRVPGAKVPEGFTANPHEVAGMGGHTFDPAVKREGFFHVTVQKDAFVPGMPHPGEAPAGVEGFGAKGDTANVGRVSLLTDRASSANYQSRITLAVDAAQGRATVPDIIDHFKPVYEEAYGVDAGQYMEKIMGMPEAQWAEKVVTPELKYRMVQAFDNNLVGAPLPPQLAAAHLTTPFESAVKIDRSQIAMVEFAVNKKASVVRGLDKKTGEVTIAHGDLHQIGAKTRQTTGSLGPGFAKLQAENPEAAKALIASNYRYEALTGRQVKHSDVGSLVDEMSQTPETGAVTHKPNQSVFYDAGHLSPEGQAAFNTPERALLRAAGTPDLVGTTADDFATHEWWHLWEQDPHLLAEGTAVRKFVDKFMGYIEDGTVRTPSTNEHTMAELTSLAFSPTADPALVAQYAEEITAFKQALLDDGVIKTLDVPASAIPAVKYGEVVHNLPAGSPLHPQINEYDASFGQQFADLMAARLRGRAVQNPDVEATTQYFAKWVQGAVYGKKTDAANKIREALSAIPTQHAVPYNNTQALLENLMASKLKLMEQDAFMLTEMSTTRSGFMRSLNHPFFGMYPASYMWGKVIPQTIRFLSKNPYSLTSNIIDVERSVAIQREFDDNFASAEQTLSESEMAFGAGYLTPGLPWEALAAHTSPWMQNLASGKPNIDKMLKSEINTISPLRWYQTIGGMGAEVLDAAQDAAQPAVPSFPGLDAGGTSLQPGTPPLAAPSAPPQTELNVSGHVAGTGLPAILQYDMNELSKLFSK